MSKAVVVSAAVTTLAVVSAIFAGSALATSKNNPSASATAAAPRAKAKAKAKAKSVMIVGDSVAVTLGVGIQRWGKTHGITVHNQAVLGCTLMDGNLVMNYDGTVRRKADSCHTRKSWPALLRKYKPDLVVALFGGQDVYNMSFDNGRTWTWAGKPAFNKRYVATMGNASTRLAATGSHVLWLSTPCFAYIKGDTGSTPQSPWYDRRRVTALGKLFHTVATKTHESVSDVIQTSNCPVNFKTRPDGVHFSSAGANAQMARLGPVILRGLG